MSFLKNKQELAFIAVAIALFICLLLFGFYAMRFIIQEVDVILNPAPPRIQDTVQYNVKALEDLNLPVPATP